jgi:hypothetical protein
MAIDSGEVKRRISIENTAKLLEDGEQYHGSLFTQTYIDAVFNLWYSSGRPSNVRLAAMLPNPADYGITTGYPSQRTLHVWTDKYFKDRGAAFDAEVSRQLAERLIAEKVAMLDSHAKIASEMQEISLTFLRTHKDQLSPNSAVRLLVEGVRIERESRGIPRTLEKLADRSDEDLMKQIEDMLLRSPMEVSPIEDSE